MEDAALKLIRIGVGIFVTLAIASSLFFIISELRNVYGGTSKIDININNQISEYLMYNESVLTGIDMINAAKRYLDDEDVTVMFDAQKINTLAYVQYVNLEENIDSRDYTSRLYNVSVDMDNLDNVVITFVYKS